MKPIFITDTQKQQAKLAFEQYLAKLSKCPNGTIDFRATVAVQKHELPKATVVFKTLAYLKTMLYVRDTTTEIAWHGTVTKGDNDTYTVHDVFLYPQKLSAATVNTDQEAYNRWITELPDDTFNKMRLQGHSHVNFGASPSGVDTAYYNDILKVLNKNDFYIFMIINKSGTMYFEIYDLEKNIIYENKDAIVEINDNKNENGIDLFKEIELDKEYFCEKPKYTTPNWSQTNFCGHEPIYTSTSKKEEDYSEYDKMWEELDNKYKNPTLAACKKPKKGAKKK